MALARLERARRLLVHLKRRALRMMPLEEHLRLAAAKIDGLEVHDVVRLARRKALAAEPGDVCGARQQELRRRNEDACGQLSLPRDALLHDIADQHDRAARRRERLRPRHSLRERPHRDGGIHQETQPRPRGLPMQLLDIGVLLLRIHEREDRDARHGVVERQRLEARDADERD